MNIILAKTAGFCFGVNRAVTSVYDSIKKYKMPVYTLGPIIHNNQVVEDLESKGVKVIEDTDDINNAKDGVVIIRSHGISQNVYNKIKENDILSIDMTCPYVKKIHRLVRENQEKGYQIIIIGDADHPEVIGINGWCNNSAVVINKLEQCYDLEKFDKICIVVQTTFSREKWEEIKNFLILNKCNEYVEFDTICSATNERQKETAEIAKTVDAMIVIGGTHSSNTQKLFNISKQYCKNSYVIETVNDLNLSEVKKFDNIGITAGASTPSWVINKVIDTLNSEEIDLPVEDIKPVETIEHPKVDLPREEKDDEDFSQALENSLKTIKNGEVVNGEVVAIDDEGITIDFGYKCEGFIPVHEYDGDLQIKVGDKIQAIVIKDNDNEGNIILSKNQLDAQKGLEKIKKAFETNSVILVKIIKAVKGGVIGTFESYNIFIPISQLSDKYISDINDFISLTIPVKVIEFDEEDNNVVASARIVSEETKQKSRMSFWDSIQIGKDFIGKVSKITSYGAFVDIGGVDGLLHISEISWSKNDKPEKYLNVDEEVAVYIKEFDKEMEKISLGLKNKTNSPWNNIQGKYSIGDIIIGKVIKLLAYGAFVEVDGNIDGLVHISQISEKHILKPEEVLEVGQMVKAKITLLDVENKKMGLSIKDVAPIDQKGESNLEVTENKSYSENLNATIGDAIRIKKLK